MDNNKNTVEKKIIAYSLDIPGWHRVANVVLSENGICTAISTQSNNLLQKVLVKVKKES